MKGSIKIRWWNQKKKEEAIELKGWKGPDHKFHKFYLILIKTTWIFNNPLFHFKKIYIIPLLMSPYSFTSLLSFFLVSCAMLNAMIITGPCSLILADSFGQSVVVWSNFLRLYLCYDLFFVSRINTHAHILRTNSNARTQNVISHGYVYSCIRVDTKERW